MNNGLNKNKISSVEVFWDETTFNVILELIDKVESSKIKRMSPKVKVLQKYLFDNGQKILDDIRKADSKCEILGFAVVSSNATVRLYVDTNTQVKDNLVRKTASRIEKELKIKFEQVSEEASRKKLISEAIKTKSIVIPGPTEVM